MEKKQTAVQWFNKQLIDRQNGDGDSRSWDEILLEALVMEREQIVDAFNDGTEHILKIIEYILEAQLANNYYFENYGGKDE